MESLLTPPEYLAIERQVETRNEYVDGRMRRKFAHYRRLESLREYVLVAQDKICIEHYRRDGDQWIFSEVGETLGLPSIDCRVSVAAIYEKVSFE